MVPPSIILLCFLNVSLQIGVSNCKPNIISRVVTALEKTLDFTLDDTEDLIVDGVFGVNMGQANLNMAIIETTNKEMVEKLKVLKEKAEKIYNISLPNLWSYPYTYYVFNNYVLPPKIWERKIDFRSGALNTNPPLYPGSFDLTTSEGYKTYIKKIQFSEEESDACLVEVATASNDTEPHVCPISKKCYELLVKIPDYYEANWPSYGVTHRLLLIQVARARNCTMDKEWVEKHINHLCSYIFWEAKKNVEYGFILELDDLLFEQVAFCGYEGYEEFFHPDIVEHFLEIQGEHGGFGSFSRLLEQSRERSKRESSGMKHDSNSHTTGLAVDAFSLILRYLLR